MSKMMTVLIIVAVLLAAAAIAIIALPMLSGGDSTGTGEVITDQAELQELALGFVQPPYADDYGSMRVAGYVDNLAQAGIYEVKITIEMRDADGNRQEIIEHRLENIEAGARRWFDIDGGTFTGPREALITIDSVELAR